MAVRLLPSETVLLLAARPTASLVVEVSLNGRPVEGAEVIVVEKALALPLFAAARTDSSGRAFFTLPAGRKYLVLAGKESLLGYADELLLERGTTVRVGLEGAERARLFIKLKLRAPVAEVFSRVVEALARLYDRLLEFLGRLLSMLNIRLAPAELAKRIEVEGAEATASDEITIWFRWAGSPLPAAVAVAAMVLATAVVLGIIAPLVIHWLFGREALPKLAEALKWIGIATAAASICWLAARFLRRLRE